MSAFLDSFLPAAAEFAAVEANKGSLLQVFPQCDELLDALLRYLTAYLDLDLLRAEAGVAVLIKVLQGLEVLLREEKYRAVMESSQEVIGHVLSLFERVTCSEVRVSALRLITSIGITPESRVEICSREGFKKVLQLMLDKDEDLTKEVARTVKHFLHIKEPALRTSEVSTLRQKVKKVFKGVARLATTMFPPEIRQIANEPSFPREMDNMPPTEKMIRTAAEDLEGRKLKFLSDEQHSATGTPVQGQACPANEDSVKESMRGQGILSTIVKALQQTAMEVQLDLMETLSILLANNVRNQREFSKLQGYQFISGVFDKVTDYQTNPQSQKFLESCFSILQSIALNGGDSKVIQNFSALEVLLHLSAVSAQVPVALAALKTLRTVVNLTWENAIVLLDADNEHYLRLMLVRATRECGAMEEGVSPLGRFEGELVEISAEERLNCLKEVDQLMRYLAFFVGSSGAFNGKVTGLYVETLRLGGSLMSPATRDLLLQSLAALIADLNARVPRAGVTSLDRGTFLSAWVGLEHCAEALKVCFEASKDGCVRALAHLAQYNLLYSELTLNSEFGVERCLVREVVESREVMSDLLLQSQSNPEVAWVLERVLLSALGSTDLNWALDSLLSEHQTALVSKLLLLQDRPLAHQARGCAFRHAFLRDSVLDYIQTRLDGEETRVLLLAACTDSSELKQYAVGYLTPTFLADNLPLDEGGLHVLLELCTERDYLAVSGYSSHISGLLPLFTGTLHLQVTSPVLLLGGAYYEPESSSSSSSVSTPSLSTANSITGSSFSSGYEKLRLITGENLHSLMRFLMRADRQLQAEVLHDVTMLAHSFHNKRVLHRNQMGKMLLAMLGKMATESQETAILLLEKIFSYSMSLEEANMLLQVSCSPDHPQKTQILEFTSRMMRLELAPEFLCQAHSDVQTATLTAFPAVKVGYSVLFWVKMRKPTKDLQPLFTWINHSRGLVLFKLSYKHKSSIIEKRRNPPLRPVSEGLKHKIHYSKSQSSAGLSMQVLSMLPPSQDCAKLFDLEMSKDWTHICFTHHRNGINLYVDGQALETYKCGYLNLSKDKICVTAVLGSERTEALYSQVVCLEDVLDEETIRRIVRAGVAGRPQVLDRKVMFVVPETRASASPFPEAPDAQLPEKEPLIHYFPRTSLSREAPDSLIHISTTAKSAFNQASALAHFFSLIHSGEVASGFKLVCHYITQNAANYTEFTEKYDWRMLAGCVQRYASQVTVDALDYLIDAVCDSLMVHLKLRKMISLKIADVPLVPEDRLPGLRVMLELISVLPAESTVQLLESLSSLLILPENIQIFLSPEVNGLQFMLNLLKAMVQQENKVLSYHLLATFERILPFFGQEHVGTLLDFMTSPDLKHHLSLVESELTVVISFVCIHIATGSASLLDKFLISQAGLLVFDLLSSPSESIRGAAIKLIALFLKTSPRYKAWFQRKSGFDMMLAQLQKHKHALETYNLLVALASSGLEKVAAFYPPDSGSAKTIINRSSIADKTLPQAEKTQSSRKIIHPDALEVLLELLKAEDTESVKADAIAGLEPLLDAENCEVLLECPFISWCAALVKSDSQKPAVGSARQREDHSQTQLYDLVTKLCVCDLYRPPRQFKFLQWLSKVPDIDFFSVRVFEGILKEVEKRIEIQQFDPNCLRNLSVLLQITELPSYNSRLIHRIMHLVNNLACGSSPAVRSQMKSLKLFDLRDDLLIHMLRNEASCEEMADLLANFSLEGLASQAKFRDTQAIFYLLKWLLETDNSDLQRELLRCLRLQVCTTEENRRQMKRAIESKALLQYLFNSRVVEAPSSMSVCFKSMKTAKSEQEDEDLPEGISETDFCEWLNERKRAMLVGVQKALVTVDVDVKKSAARWAEMKITRRKKAFDALVKDRTFIQRQVHELGLMLLTRLAGSEERCRESLRPSKDASESRACDMGRKSI